jgi:YesN/AraC family two-component response regulator
VHLLLTDVVLPDQSGYDLARGITATLGGCRTIFISGYPEVARLRKSLQGKGSFYLAKPFSAETLVKTVEEALQVAMG